MSSNFGNICYVILPQFLLKKLPVSCIIRYQQSLFGLQNTDKITEVDILATNIKFLIHAIENVKKKKKINVQLESFFEEDLPDMYLLITTPRYKGALYPILRDEKLYIHFYDNEDVRYDFNCVVVDKPRQRKNNLIKARYTSDIEREQRRTEVRLQKSMPGKLAIGSNLSMEHYSHDKRPEYEIDDGESDCLTFDISENGLSIYVNENCKLHDLVVIRLPIDDDEKYFSFHAEIMWIKPSDNPEYSRFVGLKFAEDDYFKSEKIMKFVLDLQYESMRKKRFQNYSASN